MEELIRFSPVEVVSSVCFRKRKEMVIRFEVISLLLIPRKSSGLPFIPESSLPEIFLQ